MHGEKIGLAVSPTVALAYLGVAAVLAICANFATVPATPAEHPEEPAEIPAAAPSPTA